MIDGYRIALGTLTARTLTETYAVNQFPAQSDQGGLLWFNPNNVFKEAGELVTSLDGSKAAFGDYADSWTFGKLTTEMVKYIRDTFFGTAYSATVTIRTFDRAYGWRVLNCLAQWNDPADSAEPDESADGYLNLRLDFIKGTTADSGYAVKRDAVKNVAFG